MPLGAEKAALMGAAGGSVSPNYFGDGSLGVCQFSSGSITQTGDTTAIDTVLTTGSEAGGSGSSSYGDNVPDSSSVFEFTVANKSGSFDGDMFVANFSGLTIDQDQTLTTDQPCRGLFIFVDGNATINGNISMSSRGGKSDPTVSGGSDASAVGASGLQFGVFTSGGSSSFTNDGSGYNGAGDAVIAALANMDDLSSDGDVITISKIGGNYNYNAAGDAGTTGGTTLSTGGGGAGRASGPSYGSGNAGGIGGAFSGGAGRAGYWSNSGGGPGGGQGGNYGGAGQSGASGSQFGGGAGNPAGATGGAGASPGYNGCGGVVILMVNGNLTIGSDGTIQGVGSNGGSGAGATAGGNGGGGSGGGCVMVLYTGTFTNNGSITVTGGPGNAGGSSSPGYAGGDGGKHTLEIE